MRIAGTLLVSLLLLAGLGSCGAPQRPDAGPGPLALELFELTDIDGIAETELARRFETDPGMQTRAELLDALSGLSLVSSTELAAVQPLGQREAFVDVVARIEGGGQAHYTVRLRADTPEDWRVTWFQGPGVEWPASRRRRNEGLTSSMPPRPRGR